MKNKKIKEALENYYRKLNDLYMREYGTLPTVAYSEDMRKDIQISVPDDDGEVEWKLVPVSDDIKENTLRDLKYILNQEILEFYLTYYFARLNGQYDGVSYYFYTNCYCCRPNSIGEYVNKLHEDAEYYFKNATYLLIGVANSKHVDEYLVFYDYKECDLFLYDQDTHKIRKICHSLSNLINDMEACE